MSIGSDWESVGSFIDFRLKTKDLSKALVRGFCWIDLCCVPQRNPELQLKAIGSIASVWRHRPFTKMAASATLALGDVAAVAVLKPWPMRSRHSPSGASSQNPSSRCASRTMRIANGC